MKKIIFNGIKYLYPTKLSLKMRLTIILLIVSLLKIQANTYSQNTKITLDLNNVSVLNVLKTIESNTEFNFFYNNPDFNLNRIVTVKVEKETIEKILDDLFMDTNIIHDVINKQIVLYPKPFDVSKKNLILETYIQKREIKGIVTDTDNNPLPGVNIIVVGTTRGTQTDFDGNYTIEADNDEVLEFSYIGMKTERTTVGDIDSVNIQLEESESSLDEIVVIGYGTQKKASVTGSVATIQGKDIVKNSTSNISSALSGRLAGLVTVQSSGQPGADNATMRIRGSSSLNNNSPLVLVDGIPRSLNAINSNDIESITVLKDAAAAAIYGMRAANGVILVTTKRGGGAEPQVSFNAYVASQRPTRMPDFLGSYDYATLINEANINDGKPAAYTDAELQKFSDGSDPDAYPDTDWIDETLSDSAPMQSYDLSVRGSYEKVKYFTSLGFLDQEGLYSTTGYKKYNFRSNLDVEISRDISIKTDFSGYYEETKRPGASTSTIFSNLMRTPPTEVNQYSNGGYSQKSLYGAIHNSGYSISKNFVFQSRIALDYKVPFVPGLTSTTQIAYDRGPMNQLLGGSESAYFNYGGRVKTFNTPFTYTTYDPNSGEFGLSTPADRGETASLNESASNGYSFTFEQIFDFKKTINLHEIGAKLIYSRRESRYDYLSAGRSKFVGTTIDFFIAGDEETRTNSNFAIETATLGYAGRINYSYAGKYFAEFNGRYDGSYKFSNEGKYGFFPSISAGWRISQENFLINSETINNLKIRMSYGKLGNDNIGAFRYLESFTFNEAFIDGGNVLKTLSSTGIADVTTTWETSETYNVGLELGLWNGLLSLEVDAFYTRTSDILTTSSLQVPGTFGGSLPLRNIGIVDNKGFEIILDHKNSIKDFNYYANFNFGFARNEVIDIAEAENVDDAIKRTGKPINAGSRIGWKAEGLFLTQAEIDQLNANAVAQTGDVGAVYQSQNPKPGDIKYADLNGDGIVNGEDRFVMGHGDVPEITFGLNLGFDYKQFDFSMLIQGAANFDMYLSQESAWAFFNGGKVFDDHLGRAQIGTDGDVINRDASYPRLSLSQNAVNERASTYWLIEGDYIRLKNIELGYSLSEKIIKKIGVDYFRVYVNGRNLFTSSKIKHLDPENPQQRGWFYPQQKVFTLGINVQL